MKVVKLLAGVALVVSAVLNVTLWQQLSRQRAEMGQVRAGAAEAEVLRAENEELKARSATKPATSEADSRELARLRNEVGQLRKQAAEAESLRKQAGEAGQLRIQLTATKKDLTAAEQALAEAVKVTPEQLRAMKEEGQSVACINHLKQIGLAVRLYAKEHNGAFPPDLASLKDQIPPVQVLFCPAAPGGVQATEWAQLNPATISYQFLNPNGNESDPQKPLTMCPIHGHVGYSDGSVQKKQ